MTDTPPSPMDAIRAAREDVGASGSGADAPRFVEEAGDQIGPYRLVRSVGEGGMGSVWEAEQDEPIQRRVALKIIKHGMDTQEVVRRFQAERQALARMEHPHIARVLDGGATEKGRPYFVLELVDGVPITEYCSEHGLGLDERLGLFRQTCAALVHAHQRGIIHRDVKPSNILVTEIDGAAVVKVIDFGIAKAIDTAESGQTILTVHDQVIGTPEYMAPEQASGDPAAVETRSDVYSLGVVLFELLAARRPFDLKTGFDSRMDDLMRAIREDDAPRPSSCLGQDVPRAWATALSEELDWVVLRALEKDPRRRYPSVNALAAEVDRYLGGEPVEARPPSTAYRVRKFVSRHRVGVATAAGATVLLVGGLGGTAWGLLQAIDANESLKEEQARTLRQLARANEASGILGDVLSSSVPRQARGKDTKLLRAVLRETADRLDGGAVTDPLVLADLDRHIGIAFKGLGDRKTAAHHLGRSADLRAQELGELHPDTLWVTARWAEALSGGEDADRAYEMLQATLASQRETLGPDHRSSLATATILGQLLSSRGDTDAAIALLEDTAVREPEALTEAQRAQTTTEFALAQLLLWEKEDLVGASGLIEPAIVRARKHMADDDALLIRMVAIMSQLHHMSGDLDASLELGFELLDKYSRIYGADHRSTLAHRSNLCVSLERAGRHEEALENLEASLALQEPKYGRDDVDTQWTLAQMALILDHLGQDERAEALYEEFIEKAPSYGFENDRTTISVRMNLGELLQEHGRHGEAISHFQETLAMMTPVLGGDHSWSVKVAGLIETSEAALGNESD